MKLTTNYLFNENSNQVCSGQISPQDVAVLEKEGFKHVLNLRGLGETPSPEQEKQWFDGTSIEYYHINIANALDLSKRNVEAFAKILKSVGEQKILVHCGSSNRVGAVYALKAYWLDGKSKDESIDMGEQMGLSSLKETVLNLMDQ